MLFFVRRFERTGDKGKQFYRSPWSLDGRLGWHDKALPHRAALSAERAVGHASPGAIVLLCEGEKAADAAQRMFPEHVAVAWFGGTGQVRRPICRC